MVQLPLKKLSQETRWAYSTMLSSEWEWEVWVAWASSFYAKQHCNVNTHTHSWYIQLK